MIIQSLPERIKGIEYGFCSYRHVF
jgi:hypothetical protein